MKSLLPFVVSVSLLAACQGQCQTAPRSPGQRTEAAPDISEPVFLQARGLVGGWSDYGWAPRTIARGAPVEIDFSNRGGWIIAQVDYAGSPGGVAFRYQAPREFGDFLEVRVDSPVGEVFPRVVPTAKHSRDLENGWTEVFIPMRELNPQGARFDRLVLRAATDVAAQKVKLDGIGFTGETREEIARRKQEAEERAARPARIVPMTVECGKPAQPISPLIYGIAYDQRLDASQTHQWDVGATARRWGGNASTRYNWAHGRAWNTANDWFFRNVNYTSDEKYTYDDFLEANRLRRMSTALTLPIMGWVAKDTESVSFPRSEYPNQQAFSPENADYGNGNSPDGKPISPGLPTRTSVPSTPSFIGKWVKTIREKDATRGRSVQMYMLDNEPMLWNSTHRDVHPEPTTYDELRDKLIAYGAEVRKNDPEAVIAGPGLWGWPAYFYSALDAQHGFTLPRDRLAHGNVPLLPWILRELKKHEEKTGVRVLDAVDVHHYPQANGIGIHGKGGTDEKTSAMRIRSTRALWDPTYVDESWIGEPVMLIPRIKEWIQQNYPGLGIVIGEWNFGGEHHMSGGLAVAEALGRFGQLGVKGAFYWTYPEEKSAAFWAFRAFRNFDGQGSTFLDHSVEARSVHPLTSLFVSRNKSGDKLVAVLLNLDPETTVDANLDVGSCGRVKRRRGYVYTGGPEGLRVAPGDLEAAAIQKELLPAYSITVVELELEPRRKSER